MKVKIVKSDTGSGNWYENLVGHEFHVGPAMYDKHDDCHYRKVLSGPEKGGFIDSLDIEVISNDKCEKSNIVNDVPDNTTFLPENTTTTLSLNRYQVEFLKKRLSENLKGVGELCRKEIIEMIK